MKMMRVKFEYPRLNGNGVNTYELHSITTMLVYPEKVRVEFSDKPAIVLSIDVMRRIKFIEEYEED